MASVGSVPLPVWKCILIGLWGRMSPYDWWPVQHTASSLIPAALGNTPCHVFHPCQRACLDSGGWGSVWGRHEWEVGFVAGMRSWDLWEWGERPQSPESRLSSPLLKGYHFYHCDGSPSCISKAPKHDFVATSSVSPITISLISSWSPSHLSPTTSSTVRSQYL